MISASRILLTTFIFSTVYLGGSAFGESGNCSLEAAQAAAHFAQLNNNFYHCIPLSTKDQGSEGFVVELVCVAETGSHAVTVNVNYEDANSCSGPNFVQTSVE